MRRSLAVFSPALLLLGLLIAAQLRPASAADTNFGAVRAGYFLEPLTNNPDEVSALFAQNGGDARAFGLSRPTQITFDESGSAFVAEKRGSVRVIINDELQQTPVLDISDRVNTDVDRGMNGIAVKDGWLYVAYTHESYVTPTAGTKTARISRFQLIRTAAGFEAQPSTEGILVGTLDSTAEFPSCNDRPDGADCIATDSGSHTVGNLNFGPDGKLYASIGDGAGFYSTDPHAFNAQNLRHLSGKILRLNIDGTAVDGNPFFTGARSKWDNASKVWVYGLRNPTFFNFDPQSGALLAGNVGWYSTEGAYKFEPGDNAGWPCIENGIPSISGYERMIGCPLVGEVREPFIKYAHEPLQVGGDIEQVGAITGVAVPTSDEYPEDLRGTVVYPDYVLGWVRAARLNADGSPASTFNVIGSGAQGAVGLRTGADGYLYFMIHEQARVDGLPIGTLYRLRYNNDPNAQVAPVASFRAFASPQGALAREFDASATYDPAGRAVAYAWDFGDGTTGVGGQTTHAFASSGEYTVSLTVTAGDAQAVVSQDVIIVDPPATIAYPVVISDGIFGPGHEPRPDGVSEFAPSTTIPISFEVRNLGQDIPYFVVVNIRQDGNRVARFEQHDEQLAPDTTRTYDFGWTTATPGQYTVDIEFYDEGSGQDLQGRYPSAATFVVTTRDGGGPGVGGSVVDCVDEGNGDAWGYDPVADSGCWLVVDPPDLSVCVDGGLGEFYCPDGLAYSDDGGGPGVGGSVIDCVDEGNGDAWGYDPVTDSGCWLVVDPPDLSVCVDGGLGEFYCPDGLAYTMLG